MSGAGKVNLIVYTEEVNSRLDGRTLFINPTQWTIENHMR